MAKLPQTLIPILFLLVAAANPALSQLPSLTSFFYDFNSPQSTGLTFQGDAHFQRNSNSLRLTSDRNAAAGRVLYAHPVQFWQSCGQIDFETTFTFLITPSRGFAADGIVFFMAPVGSRLPSGAVGGNLGIFDSSFQSPGVFVVEFDTYVNGWDPNFRHIGINLGSLRSANTTNVGDAIVGQQVAARINYAGATGMITVTVDAGRQRFEVSFRHDLSGFLPQQVQVGLAASTGLFVATHDVQSWYFTSTMVNARRGVPTIHEIV